MATDYGKLTEEQINGAARQFGKNLTHGMMYGTAKLSRRGKIGGYFFPLAPPRFTTRTKKQFDGSKRYKLFDRGEYAGWFRSPEEVQAYVDATLTLETQESPVARTLATYGASYPLKGVLP